MLIPDSYGFLDPLPGSIERRAARRLLALALAVSLLALIGAVSVASWLIGLVMGGAA